MQSPRLHASQSRCSSRRLPRPDDIGGELHFRALHSSIVHNDHRPGDPLAKTLPDQQSISGPPHAPPTRPSPPAPRHASPAPLLRRHGPPPPLPKHIRSNPRPRLVHRRRAPRRVRPGHAPARRRRAPRPHAVDDRAPAAHDDGAGRVRAAHRRRQGDDPRRRCTSR
jgi:hypothetical protein